MTVSLVPIQSISSALGPGAFGGISPIGGIGGIEVPRSMEVGDGPSFADVLAGQFDQLSTAQNAADRLALQAATGDLQAIEDFTVASTEAQLLTQLTVSVRNRAVEAFNDIMRMQV